MFKQFVVTKNKLNIRNRPSADSDDTFVGTLLKDEIVVLDDQPVPGTVPAGATTDLWYKDTFTRFVSAEGVRPRSFADKKADFLKNNTNTAYYGPGDRTDERTWNFSWGHVDLDIWSIWRDFDCKGEGIKVAVIDTGVVSDANDLRGRISTRSISILATPNDILTDSHDQHHGTMSVGLVGADGQNVKTVFGVAPACEVIVIRAGTGGFLSIDIFNAVKKALELQPHIISMSIENDVETPVFRDLIKTCTDKGIVVLAAAGDMGDATVSFPGAYPDCLCVGAYSLDNEQQPQLHALSNRNAMVKFLAPGQNVRSTSSTGDPAFFDASSAATAFAAGILALILSCYNKKVAGKSVLPTTRDILDALQNGNCAFPINGQMGEGFGILQPRLLIERLLKKIVKP